MCDSPRDTLPLPAEITRRILFFVSEPTITYDGRKRTYKYDRPRNLHHPPDDIQNARLVCKTFADLGAEFLFQNLIMSADHRQLAHVKEIAEHKRLCKAVRSLYYDSRTAPAMWVHYDDDSTSDSANDQWSVSHRRKQDRYYHEQEDIFNQALDTECLRTALATTLTAVTRVRCKPRQRFYRPRDPGDVSSPTRNHAAATNKDDGGPADARPLYHLAAAMTGVPAHNIRTLSLAFDVTLLADAKLAPARFASLRAALAPVTNLTLAIRASDDDYPGVDDDDPGSGLSAAAAAPSDRFARYAEAFGTHSSTASLCRALLADPATLAALVDATSPALHRFKLNLSADGRRRSGYAAFRYDDALPLSCYLGSAASDASRWPAMRYLYLGCVGVTQDELVPFLLARRRTLAFVEFDRVTLHQGQWCVVGAVVLNACPTWRWAKMSGLRQVERRRDVVDLPMEVVEAIKEVEEEEEGRWSGEKREGPRRVRWDECYFAEEDGSSTLFGGVDPETEGPGYGNPV
ncbi:hypothetical protein DIS24_g8755 [Lasiodiplodia hormozganensis]|uniref:F-box domain-containing protein n=1 Tax=Lasiodiplodia hormozganensis TaxID=869390 RepID=A0AA39XZ26_9PEZI|nr:hypothetical protein DIS24_g8755 [Lasiodiplodia hormozganensis]